MTRNANTSQNVKTIIDAVTATPPGAQSLFSASVPAATATSAHMPAHMSTHMYAHTKTPNSPIQQVTPVSVLESELSELPFAQTNSVGEQLRPSALLPIRSGYDRLSTLATQLHETQILLARGMRCAQSSVASSYHNATKRALNIFGVEYAVPNLRETVQLQLANIRQYGACVDEIVAQTTNELKSTHEYVGSLAKDMLKLANIKEKIAPTVATHHSGKYLSDLQLATGNKKQLEDFLASHDKQVHSLLQRGDFVVADRAIERKSEYLRHAYAVELLLVGSLTTAKQIAVDAGCYGSMLDRLASSYFTLGCSSVQLQNILGGLETMQRFTGSMQASVATGLQRLDKALIETRTNIGPRLESAVYQMRT